MGTHELVHVNCYSMRFLRKRSIIENLNWKTEANARGNLLDILLKFKVLIFH